MKKILIIALLSTSCIYSKPIPTKLETLALNPTTFQIVSAIGGSFLAPIIKSIFPNDTIRGGVAALGIAGALAFHQLYFKPALKNYILVKDAKPSDEQEIAKASPLVEGAINLAINTFGWAAFWSNPELMTSCLKRLDSAKLGGVAKTAAPAALIGYTGYVASMALD